MKARVTVAHYGRPDKTEWVDPGDELTVRSEGPVVVEVEVVDPDGLDFVTCDRCDHQKHYTTCIIRGERENPETVVCSDCADPEDRIITEQDQ